MRDILHYPRPSCEECGKVLLTPLNVFCWNLFNKYRYAVVVSSGMGGWNLNTDFVKDLCREFKIDSYMDLITRFSIIGGILFASKSKEEREAEKAPKLRIGSLGDLNHGD